jgi:hypothetical protein
MTLKRRIAKLEHQLGQQHCTCPNNAELSWPGHNANHTCTSCGGQRIIYTLPHDPGPAEPLLEAALPLIAKAYQHPNHADLNKLSDAELVQLKNALAALQEQVHLPGASES